MDYLNDLEKEKVIAFNTDEVLVEAIKKVLLATIYSQGTLKAGEKIDVMKNGAFGLVSLANAGRAVINNEQLGEDLRAVYNGAELLEGGFRELAKITNKEKAVESPYNEAI